MVNTVVSLTAHFAAKQHHLCIWFVNTEQLLAFGAANPSTFSSPRVEIALARFLLAYQCEMASLGLLESGFLPLGIYLSQNRCVKRRFWCGTAWTRPQASHLHGFDHRLAIHGFL